VHPVVPVPPLFSSCVRVLASAHEQSPSRRRRQLCSTLYDRYRTSAIQRLIADEWVLGGAKEIGVSVGDGEVRRLLEQIVSRRFPAAAKFHEYLRSTGQNLSGLLFNFQSEIAAERIRTHLNESVPKVTGAVVAQYYAAHKQHFAIKEERDLGFIKAKTRASALRAKRELLSGVTFAKAAAAVGVEQPVFTSEGLVHGLQSGILEENSLNRAIFRAPLHVVSGPVRLRLHPGVHFRYSRDIENIDGYYVFEIMAIRPPHFEPLLKVKGKLEASLPRTLEKQAVAEYVVPWRKRWISRTDCAQLFVVRKCRQFTPRGGEQAEDPYTLD
jgi:hypothetical protein